MAVSVKGHEGIAFRVIGPEYEPTEDGELQQTGMLHVRAIGDDRIRVVDPDDITWLDEDEYCSCCGQIGCGWVSTGS